MSESPKNSTATIAAPKPHKSCPCPRCAKSARLRGRSAPSARFRTALQVVLGESRTFPKITAQLFSAPGNASVALTNPGLAEMTAKVVRTGTGLAPQPPH